MNKEFKELSETEFEIMQYIWGCSNETEIITKSIMEHFEGQGKDWKLNTLNTFLKRLEMKGLIRAESKGKIYVYYPKMTYEEYEQKRAMCVLETGFDNSIKKFLVALNGGKGLDSTEVEELEKWFKELK